MKYISLRTWKIKCDYQSSWHRWFAWRPVTIQVLPEGAEKRAWLEWVQRKGTIVSASYEEDWWVWDYRQITTEAYHNKCSKE